MILIVKVMIKMSFLLYLAKEKDPFEKMLYILVPNS